MGLFGNKEKKLEQEAEGAAQVERLTALPVNDMALELIDAFGPDGARAKGREGTPPMHVVNWLMKPYPLHPSLKELVRSVLEGLQALEHAGLVERRTAGNDSGSQRYLLTRLGEEALANGSTRELLAPPGP